MTPQIAIMGRSRAFSGTAAAISQQFTDTFIRANANPMSLTASSGGTWVSGPGAEVDMQISSNVAQGTGAHSGAVVTKDNAGVAWTANDYTVTATGANAGTSQQWGIKCRIGASSSANGYLLYLDTTTTLTLYKVVDTGSLAFTAIGASYTITALNGTSDTIGLQVVGSTFTVFVNGLQQGTTRSDTTYTSGAPGMYDGNASGAAGSLKAFTVA